MNAPNSSPPAKADAGHVAANLSTASDGGGAPSFKDFREELKTRQQAGDLGRAAAQGAPQEMLESVRRREPKNSMLPRLKMFSDMPDKGLFVMSIACGFVLIFGLKTYGRHLGFKGDYTAFITAATALLMIAYGVIAYRMPAVRLRSDRLGDNFYYMGFIFTLASMSAALVQMRTSDDVTDLIGSFGIALVSTILGIAGRVAFVQMRTEVEDIEARVQRSLLEAADALRGQLGAAARDLETFRLGIQQTIHERLNESVSFYSDATAAQVETVKQAVEQTILSAQTAFAGHEEAAARLVKLGASVTESADRLAARLEAVNVPPEILERKIDVVVQRIDGVAASFEAAAAAERVRYGDLSESAAALRRIVTQVATQLRKLDETTQNMSASVEPAAQVATRLAQIARVLDGMAASADGLKQAIAATQEASRTVTTTVATYGDALSQLSRAQIKSAEAAARDAEAVRVGIQQDLAASRAAVREVQQSLADTVRAVTTALNTTHPQ